MNFMLDVLCLNSIQPLSVMIKIAIGFLPFLIQNSKIGYEYFPYAIFYFMLLDKWYRIVKQTNEQDLRML